VFGTAGGTAGARARRSGAASILGLATGTCDAVQPTRLVGGSGFSRRDEVHATNHKQDPDDGDGLFALVSWSVEPASRSPVAGERCQRWPSAATASSPAAELCDDGGKIANDGCVARAAALELGLSVARASPSCCARARRAGTASSKGDPESCDVGGRDSPYDELLPRPAGAEPGTVRRASGPLGVRRNFLVERGGRDCERRQPERDGGTAVSATCTIEPGFQIASSGGGLTDPLVVPYRVQRFPVPTTTRFTANPNFHYSPACRRRTTGQREASKSHAEGKPELRGKSKMAGR
jgi:hypothetical protein